MNFNKLKTLVNDKNDTNRLVRRKNNVLNSRLYILKVEMKIGDECTSSMLLFLQVVKNCYSYELLQLQN